MTERIYKSITSGERIRMNTNRKNYIIGEIMENARRKLMTIDEDYWAGCFETQTE